MKSLSHIQLFATPWTVAYQGPPSMGFSRQEYWSGLPLPSPNRVALKNTYCSFLSLCVSQATSWLVTRSMMPENKDAGWIAMPSQGHEQNNANKPVHVSSEINELTFWSLLNLVSTQQHCALKYIRWSIRFEILDSDKLLRCCAMYHQVPPRWLPVSH